MSYSQNVKVRKEVWDALQVSADTIMKNNPNIQQAWLDRICDGKLPDLIPCNRSWPLSFFSWYSSFAGLEQYPGAKGQ